MTAEVDTLIFDIDDTLYPVDSGFTVHRHSEVTAQFMVDVLGFATAEEGMAIRQVYFEKYHSTFKALKVMETEGKLPAGKTFEPASLGLYWAEHCDYAKFLSPDQPFIEALSTLPQKKVIFSNGPREYCLRCLDHLQVREFFPDDHIFCVDDVVPACKPEAAAFQKVLDGVGSTAARSVMFEDSMKNIRAAKAMGMATVLLTGNIGGDEEVDATKKKDRPDASDPAVDVVLAMVGEIKEKIPSLWQGAITSK